MKNPLALIILDGFGQNEKKEGNAITAAKTPCLDSIFAKNPTTIIGCSGMDVGLPDGQMGNSEVGHTNIGAGRVVYQELTRITKSIRDGEFYQNEEFLKAVENCKKNDSAFHIFGLMSDGGVHSHFDHIVALVELAKKQGLTKVFVHAFMDGRDVPPTSGADFLKNLDEQMAKIGVGKIATVSGRYYAMDRDNRFERVELAYNAMVQGVGNEADNAEAAVRASYAQDVTDEFVMPTIINKDGLIKKNDSIVFANFRPDRAREITRTLVDPNFEGFTRVHGYFPVYYVCMTQYDVTMPNVNIAFKPQTLDNTFGEYISKCGLTQLRIAETEKYAHVTFFFNGGKEEPYEGEDRALIASPSVATYDLKPEMSAVEVTDEAVARIESGKYDVIILNFANCDMVGHTGIFEAAKTAVEAVDTCVGRTVEAISKMGGISIITSDHGNADKMLEDDNVSPFTAHTTNPVPLTIVGADVKLRAGKLCDLAPTMLEFLGLEKPAEMDGQSLIVK